ncbi:MAG TPA: YCF48-related protein [Candidatus Binataceae bacterium]|nr:YCF48-related protein [Candidatus Binataceae bacterium]
MFIARNIQWISPSIRRWRAALTIVLAVAAFAVCGCHRKVAIPELSPRPVEFTDTFFDVWPMHPDRAFIAGSRGKLLYTADGGQHFQQINIGTSLAVLAIQMVDDQNGFLAGQDGLVMRTRDGGKSWQRLNSRTRLHIFALSFPDRLHGFLVGDRSLVLSTSDGGETFFKRQLQRVFSAELKDDSGAYEEPAYYSVQFVDDNRGWIVGDEGRIWSTGNGGKSWQEQQSSLMSQWKHELNPGEKPEFADFTLPTFYGLSFRDAQHGAACGLEGWVAQTDDGGATWRFAHQADTPGGPPDNRIPGMVQGRVRDPLYSVDLYGKAGGVATGNIGTALRLQANSAWGPDQTVPPRPVPLTQVRFSDELHGWIVGYYGLILHTIDGGKTWRFCYGQG